jgi:hypothetical protein
MGPTIQVFQGIVEGSVQGLSMDWTIFQRIGSDGFLKDRSGRFFKRHWQAVLKGLDESVFQG